jgi:putative restriction endonuclease
VDPTDLDIRLREAALSWCETLRARWGDSVPAADARHFPFEDQWIPMYGQQGIFKPRQISRGALSIRTSLTGPYQDEVLDGGEMIRYDFSPRRGENDGVKWLADHSIPLIYFVQVKPKPQPEYMVVSPVFVLGWSDVARTFEVSYQPAKAARVVEDRVAETTLTEKRYGIQVYKARLHQAHFRREVLLAYRDRCAACELRVRPLLDGAHIVPDSHPRGTPTITNGIALCSLHHRAFDRRILRIQADYIMEIASGRVSDNDPAARSMLLDLHGKPLQIPKRPELRPDPENLRIAADL